MKKLASQRNDNLTVPGGLLIEKVKVKTCNVICECFGQRCGWYLLAEHGWIFLSCEFFLLFFFSSSRHCIKLSFSHVTFIVSFCVILPINKNDIENHSMNLLCIRYSRQLVIIRVQRPCMTDTLPFKTTHKRNSCL